MEPMSNSTPYALEIMPAAKPGTFQWTIRRHGTLIERSDRPLRSEEDAIKNGEKAMERQLAPGIGSR